LIGHCSAASAQTLSTASDATDVVPPAVTPAVIRNMRSQYVMLRTDLGRREAQTMLTRLDAKLREVSSYWSQSVTQPIECFVVADLNNWSEEQLGHPYAREVIRRVGGFATRSGGRKSAGTKLYCNSDLNVALHEMVHAYCLEAFPDSGPDWYKEGMAVYFANSQRSANGVQIGNEVIEYLRNAEYRTVQSIVESRDFTRPIATIILSAVGNPQDFASPEKTLVAVASSLDSQEQRLIPLAVNNSADQKTLDTAIMSYRWSWALCHFLAENENYKEQFGKLGQAYLAGARPRLDQVFTANGRQLESEFRQFVQQLGRGYRVDLCHWDWSDHGKTIDERKSAKTKVCSRRGLQTSGLLVQKGSKYAVEAVGRWSISSSGAELDAQGRADGAGQLTAAVLTDTKMGPPIEIGVDGTFVALESGTLFFRCRDSWLQLADNRGCIHVSIRHVADADADGDAE
jgi:hypothetical protein